MIVRPDFYSDETLLAETGELEEVRAMAAKKILAADIRHMMDQRGF